MQVFFQVIFVQPGKAQEQFFSSETRETACPSQHLYLYKTSVSVNISSVLETKILITPLVGEMFKIGLLEPGGSFLDKNGETETMLHEVRTIQECSPCQNLPRRLYRHIRV